MAKKTMVISLILMAVAGWLLASPASAFDKGKCKSNADKLIKLVKPFKSLSFKNLLKDLEELDQQENGMDAKQLEDFINPPFEDPAWSKKFVTYLKEVEKYCVAGQQ